MFWIAWRALKGRWALALLSVLSVALAVGLAVSVPIFAQSVSRAMMEQELTRRAQEINRWPLTVRHYVLPTSQQPLTTERCVALSDLLAETYRRNLGLPVISVQLRAETSGLLLKTATDGPYGDAGSYLGNVALGFITSMEFHADVLSGEPLGTPSTGDAVNVWMSEDWASEMGVQPGERFTTQPMVSPVPINLRVAGTWRPRDPADPFWPMGGATSLHSFLVVNAGDYATMIEPYLGSMPVGSASWVITLDRQRFVPELAESYVRGLQRAEVEVGQMLPGVKTDVTPLPILQAHLQRIRPMTVLLFGFAVPIVGFVLYFLTRVSLLAVESQRRVMATIVSRGMSPRQVLLLNLYQGLFTVLLGTPPGILLGLAAARLMGHATSFMVFAPQSDLTASLNGLNIGLVVAALLVSLLARVWPAVRESRWGVVEYLAQTTRPTPGVLGRLHLELLLVVPTAYLYHQLRTQGSIVVLGWKSTGDIFRDPALFVVPALFMLTAALLAANTFPLLMRLLDVAISGRLRVVGCLTLRQLGRRSRDYASSLLLIMVSLSVGVFMASMARSLDSWQSDRAYYPLGADAVLTVIEAPEEGGPTLGEAPAPFVELVNPDTWLIPREALEGDGIEAATWVGRYRALVPTGATTYARGFLMVIDRLTFPQAAWFRADFADVPLGDLMNRLGTQPNAVLVSQALADKAHLRIGDALTLKASVLGATERDYQTVVVGFYRYFPTVLHEDETPVVIGNLDHLITTMGGVPSYEIWMRASREALATGRVQQHLASLVPSLEEFRDVWTEGKEEREARERLGVYGTLSVGFVASLLLSGIGLLIQYQRSLHERLSRFAMLRALGLRSGELFAQVQAEYLIVLAGGVLAGLGIGWLASTLFIPYFRVATAEGALPIPPLVPLIDGTRAAWMTGIFGAVQVLAQMGLIGRALQTQLFQVLRMGNQE